HGSSEGLDDLVKDCKEIFNIGYEAVLTLDLSGYKDSFMLSSLIGAPPGYIGYEDEGVLSKHILAYPSSILVLKNFSHASGNISSFLLNSIKSGFFTDQKSRLIQFDHVIVIVEGMEEKKSIGFNEHISTAEDTIFDEEISNQTSVNNTLNHLYEKALSRLNYEISFDFDINLSNKKKVNGYLYEFMKKHQKGKYQIHKEDILDNWL
ncbi:AAA domain-containing protein, partial [bacterium]|nr:AAA domain-containing protein [bacterium]